MFKSKNICFLFAAIALNTAASAAIITVDIDGIACADVAAGLCTSVPSAVQIDFTGATVPSPYLVGAATFSFAPGNVTPFVDGSIGGQYAAPPNDSTRYLTIGSPGRAGSVTIDFSQPVDYYGFYIGSVDSYNEMQFFETGNNTTPIGIFTGNDVLQNANGDQSIGQYLNFRVTGGKLGRIVLSSSQAAMESDNHAYSLALPVNEGQVPEPATMGLMGAALFGFSLYFRKSRS